MTKYRKNEALIRNDGVYVISGIFCGAHEGRALCAKQAEVSPVSNKSHKHALRAMWIDDCELWVKMHSRPGRCPSKARRAEVASTRSEAQCAAKGREAAGAPRTRSEAKSAGAEHRASVSAGRCEDKQSKIPPANRGFINDPPAKGLRDTGRSR